VSPAPPAAAQPGAVDIGFAQDMIVHHEQAVVMAQLVRGRATDPLVAATAAGIEYGQLLEIGQMRGYLQLWDAPSYPSGEPMTWMTPGTGHTGHAAHGSEMPRSAMPGMATQDDLDALRRATGPDLDVLFLQLMLRHHQGGAAMLADAAAHASVPAVRDLAKRMTYHQTEEGAALLQQLAAHRARPLT
jgi:uncharacterized protein (DUF305 family)